MASRPSAVTEMPSGAEKLPSPAPGAPNTKAGTPSGWNTWTRSLPVSATAIMPPYGMKVTACGAENCPTPVPVEPNE